MPKLTITISESILAKIERQKPDYLDRSAFLNLLLDQQLDSDGTLGAPSAAGAPLSTTTSILTNTSTSNNSSNKEINKCVEQHEELIREFWRVKRGSKGETAWKLLMTELEKLQRRYGERVVSEQLTLAINGKWQGVSSMRYEQYKPKDAPPPRREPERQLTEEERQAAHLEEMRKLGLYSG